MRKLFLICCIITLTLVGCEESDIQNMSTANLAAFSDDELREMGLSDEDILALRDTVSGNGISDPDSDLYFTDIDQLTKDNYMYYIGDLPEDGAKKGTVYYELVEQGLMPGFFEADAEIEEDEDVILLNAYGNPMGDNYHPLIEFKDSKYGRDIPVFMEEAIDEIASQNGFTNIVLVDTKEDVNDYNEALVIYTYHMYPCRGYNPDLHINAPNYDEYTIILNLNVAGITVTSMPNAYETYKEPSKNNTGTIAIDPADKITPTPTPIVTPNPTRVPVVTPIPTSTPVSSESSSTPAESSLTPAESSSTPTEVPSEEQVATSDEQVVSSDEVVSSSD